MTTTWTAPSTATANETIASALWNANRDDLNHLKERDPLLTNNSGGALVEGDVVIQDTSADLKAITTATAGHAARVLVSMGTVADLASGYFRDCGHALVNVTGAVTRGSPLQTSTTLKQAIQGAVNPFAIALQANASGSALIECELIPRPVDGSIGAAMLKGSLATDCIQLPLADVRLITTNEIAASGAADGGILSSDTAPSYKRVNLATDKQTRITWPAGNVAEVHLGTIYYPPDLDDTQPVLIHLFAGMGGGSDTPVLTVAYFEGVGDTDAGGNTAALSSTAADKTVSIAAADVGVAPKVASITVKPGAHATDTVVLYGAAFVYSRAAN